MPSKDSSPHASIASIAESVKTCTQCPLHLSRTHAVPGEGPLTPKIMLIGEAPGKNEDLQGKPFVGAAGKKLDALLEKAGLHRKDIFITSILKCRPPDNRVPTKSEADTCTHAWLHPQIQLLQPKIIGLMGRTAIQYVMGKEFAFDLSQDHGKLIEKDGQRYALLYHPAAMIYNQKLAATLEEDFKILRTTSEAFR